MSSKLTEKKLLRREPISLSADGTTTGIVTISEACNFKVKQCITLQSATQPPLNLEVKRFIDDTSFYVGEVGKPISHRSDVSAYTVADSAFIFAIEQNRPSVPEQEIERLTYEEEPTIARRVVIVDKGGEIITDDNPLPTTAVLENPHTVVANIVTAGVPITITAPGSAPIRAFSLYAPRVGPNAGTNSINRYVIYSTDSGSTYKTLPVNEWIAEPGLVTDLRIDASHNGMKVEVEIRY